MQDPTGIQFTPDLVANQRLTIEDNAVTPLAFNESKRPYFLLGRRKTTGSFDREKCSWSQQSVTFIADPLGIHGETLIGQGRTERPRAEAHPAPSARLEEETVKALFPIFVHPDNEWLLSALIEGLDNKNILGYIHDQLDQINDHQRVENLKRKILLNPFVPEQILFDKCIFCNIKLSQVIDSLGTPGTAVSIHNDYPFAPLMHKVVILQQRKHDIAHMTPEEITSFYELLYQIVKRARDDYPDLDGITYGMNYGLPRIHKGKQVVASGASQPHLHSQICALTRDSLNVADRLGLLCSGYRKRHGRDYLDDYLKALREADLVLKESEDAILYVPIAQRFNYEVQIMVKSSTVGHILETTPQIRKAIGELEYQAYMMYQHHDVDIQSFNTVMYATRFSAKNDCGQRMIISVYPRTTIIALSELANRYVVDSYPWSIASVLKGAWENVLARGPRKLKVLVIGAHPDDIELGCGGSIVELSKRGHEIHAVVVTDGCGGADRVPAIREKEANAAAGILGISTVCFGRIRDGQAHPGDTLFNLIDQQIERQNPDYVLVHADVGSEHTDHKNVSGVVKTLCARRMPPIMRLMYEVATYNEDASFRPNVYVNIDTSMEQKRYAVKEHQSELERKTIDIQKLEHRARRRAGEIGADVTYAEAFVWEGKDEERRELEKLMPFVKVKESI